MKPFKISLLKKYSSELLGICDQASSKARVMLRVWKKRCLYLPAFVVYSCVSPPFLLNFIICKCASSYMKYKQYLYYSDNRSVHDMLLLRPYRKVNCHPRTRFDEASARRALIGDPVFAWIPAFARMSSYLPLFKCSSTSTITCIYCSFLLVSIGVVFHVFTTS